MNSTDPFCILRDAEQLSRLESKLKEMGEAQVFDALLDPRSYKRNGMLKPYSAAKIAGMKVDEFKNVIEQVRCYMFEYMDR